MFLGFFISPALAQLQQNPTSTTTLPSQEELIKQLNDQREQLLKMFGIPTDAETSIFDVFRNLQQGKSSGASKKPLFDAEIEFNTQSFDPGAQIRASVKTYSTDPAQVRARWYQNGKEVLSGTGALSYTFTLGQLGSSENILVKLSTPDGYTKELSKILRPANIHLTWSSDSYTPSWYQGKGLAPAGSSVIVYATPDFRLGQTTVNPNDLYYEWSLDDSAANLDPAISGKGKRSYVLNLSTIISKTYRISVRIHDASDRVSSQESITITPSQPTLIYYPLDPLFGEVSWRALQNNILESGESVAIQAEPFYVPRKDIKSLTYAWRVNGNVVQNVIGRILNFTTEEGASGGQRISTSFENKINIFQRGSASINLYVQK